MRRVLAAGTVPGTASGTPEEVPTGVNMKRKAVAPLVAAFIACIAWVGCTQHDESQGTGTGVALGEKAAPAAGSMKVTQGGGAGQVQSEPARALYRAFRDAFSATLSGGDTADALKERIELAEKTRMDALVLAARIGSAEGASFLSRLVDRLERYSGMAKGHLQTLEEEKALRDKGRELEEKIRSLAGKDKDRERNQAVLEYNSLWDTHKDLVTNRLAEERRSLEALSGELMDFK